MTEPGDIDEWWELPASMKTRIERCRDAWHVIPQYTPKHLAPLHAHRKSKHLPVTKPQSWRALLAPINPNAISSVSLTQQNLL